MNGVKIFLVGKEATSDTERVLESLGYEFQLTPSVEEAALQSLKKRNILILIETSSKEDFPEFFSKVKNLETPVIMLAENADELITPRGNQPYGYLVKPYHESELKFNINQAIFKKELERKFKRSEDILNISMNMAKMVY
ncbi:MAG: hypothetical protein CVV29_10165, partial [Methanobacteriales archaeon HGW-Methanobacteriales-2]